MDTGNHDQQVTPAVLLNRLVDAAAQWQALQSASAAKRLEAARRAAFNRIRADGERIAALEASLRAVLAHPKLEAEFHYYDQGIGSATNLGKALLHARALIRPQPEPAHAVYAVLTSTERSAGQ
ncbi:MAG TPA: hypothetical protein VNP72_09645 [Longimicrobium sp.]|nr:hypothetical protein [Longimicrobium sp.]